MLVLHMTAPVPVSRQRHAKVDWATEHGPDLHQSCMRYLAGHSSSQSQGAAVTAHQHSAAAGSPPPGGPASTSYSAAPSQPACLHAAASSDPSSNEPAGLPLADSPATCLLRLLSWHLQQPPAQQPSQQAPSATPSKEAAGVLPERGGVDLDGV